MAADELTQDLNLSDSDIGILAEDLAYADAVAPGLGRELVAFVLTGVEPPLLANPAGLDQHKLFETLAPRNYKFGKKTPEQERRIASRLRLHDLSVFHPLVMVRLGCLVAIGRSAGLGSHSLPGTSTTPYWLPALIELDEDFPDPAGRAGRWLDLTIGGDGDRRLDAIAAMQANGVPRVLVAIATRDAATITLSPIAAMADGADRLQSFDLWEPPRVAAPRRTLLDRLKEGVGALRQRPAAAFTPVRYGDSASALLARAEDEALALAELGGRMEDRTRLDRLARIASELDGASLSRLAALLSYLAASSTRERPLRLLAFVHAARCHAGLTFRTPLVSRGF